MAQTGLEGALKSVRALRRKMNRETAADYAVTLSASTAGQGNLAQQTGLYARGLGATNRTVRRSLAGLTRKARATQLGVARAQAGVVSRYGGASAGVVGALFAPARAGAKSASQVQAALKGVGAAGQRTAATALGVARAGVGAQAEAAKYALAQALMSRNIATAETVGRLTSDLYSQAFQAQQAWDLWKKQQDYLQSQKEAGTPSINSQLGIYTGQLPGPVFDVWNQVHSGETVEDEQTAAALQVPVGTPMAKLSPFQLASFQAAKLGFAQDDPRFQLLVAATQKMQSGTSPDQALGQAIQMFYGAAEGYDQNLIQSVVSSGISATATAYADSLVSSLTPEQAAVENIEAILPGAHISYAKALEKAGAPVTVGGRSPKFPGVTGYGG